MNYYRRDTDIQSDGLFSYGENLVESHAAVFWHKTSDLAMGCADNIS